MAQLVSVREVMEATKLSRSCAYELMHRLGSVKVFGRSTRIFKDKLDAHIRALEHADPKPSAPQKPKYRGPGVYAVEGAPNWIKIGRAQNIAERISGLQTSTPMPLRLLAVLSTNPGDEARFHEQWKRLRSYGEWFRADAAMTEWLRTAGVVDL